MLIKGIDPGGAERPLTVDENGTLEVAFVSGVSVSVVVDGTSALPVYQVSGSAWSVAFDQTTAMLVNQVSGSSWSVNIASGSSAGTEYGETATADPGVGGLIMVKNSAGSIYVPNIGSGTSDTALRTAFATDSVASVNIVSGSTSGIQYTEGATGGPGDGTMAMVKDSAGSIYSLRVGSGVSDIALRVVQATDSIGSVSIVSSPNGLTVDQLSGSAWSTSATIVGSTGTTAVVGTVAADVADDGSAPILTGGIARTANPVVVAAGDRVSATFDVVGRQVMQPYQVRGLVQTAFLALANGTETNLLAGSAGVFHDLAYIVAANTSNAVVDLNVRCGTDYGVVLALTVPADSTAGIAPAVPLPQDIAGQPWTVDMDDITGTTVNVSALFIKNV